MQYLPIGINLAGKRVLIVGGGSVALRKIETLEQYTHDLWVLAPAIRDEIRNRTWINTVEREYRQNDLDGFFIVIAATDDKDLNLTIAGDARQYGSLVSVASDPAAGDFISPAVYNNGNMSVAVSSDGLDVKKSVRWRNRIARFCSEGFPDN
ncbi:MAG: bifunctional precorrin-2 dehydrogenase/sirohydrochlorin ferrochelatase [Bacteroidales bacterium]|jgi:precorrin-2 dehydrogenase/sirohydrochlorin ferrochelatase|nr:bifunctional precorrin-2 dehydrogenase/sirohydrochlorin ferrochelatase [Bacteroidales bacterium]